MMAAGPLAVTAAGAKKIPIGLELYSVRGELKKDQVGTVRRAYAHFGLELSDRAAAAMQSFLDANPADKHGKHLYSFEDTGLDEEALRGLFSKYETYFDIPREPLRTKQP